MASRIAAIQTDLAGWLWRLLPANPIVVRVVHGASRRKRHLLLRILYLTILTVVVLGSTMSMGPGGGSLTKMAKNSSQAFVVVSYAQLALVCFLAPVFTAGAITQERDNHTYNILIATPLSNAQIILGSLLSRLYFVVVLMASGIPIFAVTMIYGGVTDREIIISFVVSTSTALLMGAIAIVTSVVRVGSSRTIFSFYLVIAVYLLGIYFLRGNFPTPILPGTPIGPGGQSSYVAPLHPFLCLEVAMNVTTAPDPSAVAFLPWPVNYAVAHPYEGYVVWTLLLATGLILFSMLFVRRGIREGELSIFKKLWMRLRPITPGTERRRRPRHVWANPMAWREAATRAAATRGGVRWAFLLGGTAAAIWLVVAMFQGRAGVSSYLMGVVLVEFGAIMLFATNLAAGALTKEYESNTMDLLLTSPLTSRYVIWGKLRGLVSAVLPLIAVPVLTILAVTVAHWIGMATGSKAVIKVGTPFPPWAEAWLQAAVLMVIHVAWACMLGMNRSLYATRTVTSVMTSIALLLLICAISSGLCNYMATGEIGKVAAPFSPFLSVAVLSDPSSFIPTGMGNAARAMTNARILTMVGTVLASFLISLLVYQWYRSMVKNFDMIVRKKSR